MSRREEPKEEVAAPLICTKELYREPNIPRKIQQIRFGVQTPQEIVKCGVFNVYERTLYKMPERMPHPNGVLDRRLGISNKNFMCETCGQRLAECAGHFGFIRLELPVFHIGYFKNTVQILQCICKSCAHLLLPDEQRQVWLKKFRNPRVERTQRESMFRRVNELCKRTRICPHCGEWNGTCKKATGSLKIIHEKYLKNDALFEAFKGTLDEALRYNDQLKAHLSRAADDLHPLRVRSLFERIPSEDCGVLDVVGRPEDLVITHLTVPPVCIRPSVDMDGASNEDDITMKLMQIIEVNNVLRQGLEKGLPVSNLMENWDFLQVQCAMLINSDLPGLPLQFQTPGRPLRGFVQRLKGKAGRFRGNLSGKRVDFSGRTVISPDPNLAINQVCVPKHMAVVLTYPERVTKYSMDKLRQRILNGSLTWPGANYVVSVTGERMSLKFGDRRKVAADLKVGDTVERHCEDGDVVLFNRQPSLHRISIMAFRAKVRMWRTLRFNECVCTPFNADFDGDEMNLHLPQTEEARAEAINLMGSVNNLCTPKNGEILIASTQDFLTCAYLVTCKDTFYTRADVCLLASYMTGSASEVVELPVPAVIKPLELWTGKQLFSLLLRPNRDTRIFLNVEMPEKQYSKRGEHMCPQDGYVCFRNSELLCGRIGKVVLGGKKGGLYGTLNSDFSAEAAAQVMSRLARLSARHMGNRGFSIGIDDVTPAHKLQVAKAALLDKGYTECQGFIQAHKKGMLEVLTGCNVDQTLENRVMGVLNDIREAAANICMNTLRWNNSPLIMSQCGSKGSPINIAQMVACVGQQSVGGKRAFNGFKLRTLPHFPRNDRTPAGKGFVANSFYSGLTATEFWFHTMGGREGLVDTAVKTAETGYMSRRLMKALEDLYTHYDSTVRNAAGGIVQFMYGDDGLDPLVMEADEGKPIDFGRTLAKVRATVRRRPLVDGGHTEVPLPAELEKDVARVLASRPQLAEVPLEQAYKAWCSNAYLKQLRTFLTQQVEKYKKARLRVGLPDDMRGDAALEYAVGMEGLTPSQLTAFINKAIAKYDRKRIDPGATVGAVGAQSIGEPGTQMTLKTFHFAGVASMNVTQGVPRIKEIINHSKNISTPIMTVALEVGNCEVYARMVKARLERLTLGQVARSLKIVFRPGRASGRVGDGEAVVSIRLDGDVIHALQLPINADTVKAAILCTPRMKLKEQHVQTVGDGKLVVRPNVNADTDRGAILFALDVLLKALPKVIVSGIPTVERAVIKREKDGVHTLLVEGTDLRRVMATPGVLGRSTTINHVAELEKYLGIEAARRMIIEQIETTMGAHGMSIDHRHTMLLADCMTYKGEVLGITRFGISKMKDSVLHTASFEKTSDHLFDAAIHGRCDDVVGVSESIIMGIPMPVGTGIFRIRQNCTEVGELPLAPPPVLVPRGVSAAAKAGAGAKMGNGIAPAG